LDLTERLLAPSFWPQSIKVAAALRRMDMASKKQIEANRANARKSTGAKTDMGKFISRFNAVKHGLASQKMVTLVGESNDAYLELLVKVMFE
jgi:hypothetical protein